MDNENTQNDPIQLFNRVIESNQENILTNQATLIAIANFEKLAKMEEEHRRKFVEPLPPEMEIRIPDEHLQVIKSFNKTVLKSKNLQYFQLGSVAGALLIILISCYFAVKWYSESIRAKSELRQEILDEVKNDGKGIYKVEEVKQLQHNTELMNKWMQRNPKAAEKFLRYKDGYESR